MYIRELVVSYRPRASVSPSANVLVATPESAAALFASLIGEEPVEVFGMLCLTTKRQLIAYHEISRGGIDQTIVSPREVFQTALLSHASGIVVGHNHPSGDPNPSPDDWNVTKRLIDAGTLMGINILDHIIVGHDGQFFSFKDKGEITCR